MKSLVPFKPALGKRAFSSSTGRRTSQLSEHASVPPKKKKQECTTGLKRLAHPNEQDDEASVLGEAERPLPTSDKPDAD